MDVQDEGEEDDEEIAEEQETAAEQPEARVKRPLTGVLNERLLAG